MRNEMHPRHETWARH